MSNEGLHCQTYVLLRVMRAWVMSSEGHEGQQGQGVPNVMRAKALCFEDQRDQQECVVVMCVCVFVFYVSWSQMPN